MEVPAKDKLRGRTRIALEPHDAGLPSELLAGSIPMDPIEDLPLVQRDGLVLPMLPYVLLERRELRLGHRGEHQCELMGLIRGHRGVTLTTQHRRVEFFEEPD